MRFRLASVLFGCMLCSGCALVEDCARNVILAMRTPIAEHREIARNRRWAEAAWVSVCSAEPGVYTKDHGEGFKDGYAEYLFRGGDGESSLVAPLHYRQIKYQSPQGYAAIQDWFSGYRHGASAARLSGTRHWITGPSALPPDPHRSLAAEIHPPPPIPQNFEIQRSESGAPKVDLRVALRPPAATAAAIGPIIRIGAISDGSSHAIRARVATIRTVSQEN